MIPKRLLPALLKYVVDQHPGLVEIAGPEVDDVGKTLGVAQEIRTGEGTYERILAVLSTGAMRLAVGVPTPPITASTSFSAANRSALAAARSGS